MGEVLQLFKPTVIRFTITETEDLYRIESEGWSWSIRLAPHLMPRHRHRGDGTIEMIGADEVVSYEEGPTTHVYLAGTQAAFERMKASAERSLEILREKGPRGLQW